MSITNKKIAVIGLGYVGLPLTLAFAKKYSTIGFDVNSKRIAELNNGTDVTKEVHHNELVSAISNSFSLALTDDSSQIQNSDIYIVTVPTPVDQQKLPDLTFLLEATKMLGAMISPGNIVIYESTVYPGCTEHDCVPILESTSGLKYNIDFFCGYSPERINPGDRVNTLTTIKKVTSGSTPEIAEIVDQLYSSIIDAGTFKAKSIKVAEACKAIENAQRDVNISFVNELALIFDRVGIDTQDVLDAAGTKWNFLKYKPGLVGGHCISVDPYYLAHKAESLGYHPQVILSGRRVNDNMGMFVANKLVKLLIAKDHVISKSNVLVLGITFKEDCPDIRNSKVIDIIKELQQFNISVDVFDPHASHDEVMHEYSISMLNSISSKYEAIILAVSHEEFRLLEISKIKSSDKSIIYDTKSFLKSELVMVAFETILFI